MKTINKNFNPSIPKQQVIWNVFWLILLAMLFMVPLNMYTQSTPVPPPPPPAPTPAPPPPPPPASPTFSQSLSQKLFNNGKTKIQYKSNGIGLKIEYEGDVTLSEDEKDIVGLTKGGYFYIEKSAFGSKRKIKIETDRKGNLVKEYYVGRKNKGFIPEGKKWLAEILPEVLRSTTIAAPNRVNKFYNLGGVPRVLDEIEQMESDHVSSTYYQLLLNKDIKNSEYSSIVKSAGRVIDSDHYLAEVLMDNHMACFSEPAMIDAFIEASGEIDSDHYLTEVLKKVILNKDVTDAQVASILSISDDIQSDHYLSVVLIDVLEERNMTERNISSIIELSNEISSDHYKSEVLKEVLSKKNLSNEAMKSFVESLKDIGSDHYVTEVILHMSRDVMDTPEIVNLFDMISNHVNSDHYKAESFKKIISNHKLDNASFKALTNSMQSINSDHYLVEVFVKAARKRNITEQQVIDLIGSLSHVNSDSYITESLIEVSDIVSEFGGQSLKAYKDAAEQINSDSYYGKAMKALN